MSHMYRSFIGCFLIAFLMSFFFPISGFAETWRIKKTGTARMYDGKAACMKEAEAEAVRAAVLDALMDFPDAAGIQAERVAKIAKNKNAVIGIDLLESHVQGGGCEVKIKSTINTVGLKEALMQSVRGKLSDVRKIAVVVQYFIDSMPASTVVIDNISYNPEDALNSAKDRLKKAGLRMVSLDVSNNTVAEWMRDYAKSIKKIKSTYIVGTSEDEKYRLKKQSISEAGAGIRDMALYLNSAQGRKEFPEISGFSYISIGRVDIAQRGRKANSPNFLAEFKVALQVVDVQNAELLGQSATVSGLGEGRTKASAVTVTMNDAIQIATAQIITALASDNEKKRTYTLIVKGITNQRKQARPLRDFLEKQGVYILDGNKGFDRARQTLQLSITYKGTAGEYMDAVNKALDMAEENKVLRINDAGLKGNVAEVILQN